MSIYYGLIIPRSYNDYINKSQPEEFRKAMDNTGLIPNAASEENQLADKNFVNSTVGTNTANYIYKTNASGENVPFSSILELEAYAGTVTQNDYAFVTGTDESGNVYFDRYKANETDGIITWGKEYRLNNSSFTADQWAAIQSGITAELVEKFNAAAVPAVDKVEVGEMAPVTSNAVNGALTDYTKLEDFSPINKVNNANLAVPSNVDNRLHDTVFYIDYLGENIPLQVANYRIEFKCRYISGGYSNAIQIAYAINSSNPNIYVRYCSIDLSTKIWTFGNWEKITTESDLNTTLATSNVNIEIGNDSKHSSVTVYKKNGIVTFGCIGYPINVGRNDWTTIGVLPAGYRPLKIINTCCTTYGPVTSGYIQIKPNGEIQYYNENSSQTLNTQIHFSISFVTE